MENKQPTYLLRFFIIVFTSKVFFLHVLSFHYISFSRYKEEIMVSLFQLFVLATLLLSTVLAIFIAFKLRERLTTMHGMVITMALGMNIGLTSGVLFGSLYQGNLYLSTIISIAIGALAGLACGISFGLLPSLEGFMSGLMGGMMGAMLGEMITLEQSAILTNIMLALTTSSLLLFQVFSSSKAKANNIEKKGWFWKPFFTFVFVSSFLLFGYQLDNNTNNYNSTSPDTKHHDLRGNQSDLAQQIKINVTPSSYAYTPSEIIVKESQL